MWKTLDYADIARFCNASGAHATTIDACRIGLSLDPENPMLYVYRACAYDELGQLPQAVADCEAALRLAPRGQPAVYALITLALIRERMGDHAAALDAVAQAIAIEPADREAHAARGTLLAWHGDYPAAWPELECHWLDERIAFLQRFPDMAEWNGEPIDGRRLLIVHGQGLGDLLQMLRYVPRLRDRCASILLECSPSLTGLLRGFPGLTDVFATGTAPRDRFDVFARAMTLARLCGEDGTPGHSGVPYITAGAGARAAFAGHFTAARDKQLRVGIAWAGSPAHPNDRRRSIPPAALAPFAAAGDVAWYSLQVGERAGDPMPDGFALKRFGDAIADMSNTAAIVTHLDLVISADTSVAHLAGAMGIPVWLLLPWRPDWRWSPTANGTPWYPSMRLFHATDPGWSNAIAAAADALAAVPKRTPSRVLDTSSRADRPGQ